MNLADGRSYCYRACSSAETASSPVEYRLCCNLNGNIRLPMQRICHTTERSQWYTMQSVASAADSSTEHRICANCFDLVPPRIACFRSLHFTVETETGLTAAYYNVVVVIEFCDFISNADFRFYCWHHMCKPCGIMLLVLFYSYIIGLLLLL